MALLEKDGQPVEDAGSPVETSDPSNCDCCVSCPSSLDVTLSGVDSEICHRCVQAGVDPVYWLAKQLNVDGTYNVPLSDGSDETDAQYNTVIDVGSTVAEHDSYGSCSDCENDTNVSSTETYAYLNIEIDVDCTTNTVKSLFVTPEKADGTVSAHNQAFEASTSNQLGNSMSNNANCDTDCEFLGNNWSGGGTATVTET